VVTLPYSGREVECLLLPSRLLFFKGRGSASLPTRATSRKRLLRIGCPRIKSKLLQSEEGVPNRFQTNKASLRTT
jgi:hypothetical protein